MAATAALSVTSQRWVAMPGARSMVSLSACSLRSTANTLAPSSTKRTVVARPLPQPGPTEPAPVTIATLPCSLEPIQARRVVHQQCLLLRGRGGAFLDQVDEVAVVGHEREVRVRPVGAPQRPIAALRHQLARERRGVL